MSFKNKQFSPSTMNKYHTICETNDVSLLITIVWKSMKIVEKHGTAIFQIFFKYIICCFISEITN